MSPTRKNQRIATLCGSTVPPAFLQQLRNDARYNDASIAAVLGVPTLFYQNAVNEPLPQHALDLVTAQGIGVALGKLDDASLARKFSEQSGLDLVDSGQRVHAIKAVYQAQADSAIESRSGITSGDAPDFWAWARANHGGQLQDAIGRQLRGHDVSGYKALADRWMSETPPSMAAIKAAGIPTRTQSKGPECYINGIWMSPSGAAKAGLI